MLYVGALSSGGPGAPWLVMGTIAEDTSPDTAGSAIFRPLGDLWVAEPGDEATRVAGQVARLLPAPESRLNLLLRGETEGTISAARLDHPEGLTVVATGLADVVYGNFAFTRMEDEVGDVALLDWETGALDPLASGVPLGGIRTAVFDGVGYRIYIRDADPDTRAGTLEVRDALGQREILAASAAMGV
jgi:hypothetical protein